jgi:hypothetical protein
MDADLLKELTVAYGCRKAQLHCLLAGNLEGMVTIPVQVRRPGDKEHRCLKPKLRESHQRERQINPTPPSCSSMTRTIPPTLERAVWSALFSPLIQLLVFSGDACINTPRNSI